MLPIRSIVTPPTWWPSMIPVSARISVSACAERAAKSRVDTTQTMRLRLKTVRLREKHLIEHLRDCRRRGLGSDSILAAGSVQRLRVDERSALPVVQVALRSG